MTSPTSRDRAIEADPAYYPNTEKYGAKVRWLRAGMGWSLRFLSHRVGITPSYLSDIETGRRLPAPEVSDRIASTLAVDRDALWRLALLERLSERDLRVLIGHSGPFVPDPRFERSVPASEAGDGEALSDETDAMLAEYFDARRGAIINVVAHKASPPEYPGLALVPVSDIERLEQFIELPRERAEYTRLAHVAEGRE